jgi:hypothetical protein
MENNSIKIEILIEYLVKEIEKGGKTIEYNGTLLCPENGNSIIITSEIQM